MTLRKILGSINTPARLLGLAALGGVLTLSACTYHGHHGRHHGGAAVELELQYDGERVCCKRRRRDWWAHSHHDCHDHGGRVVSHHYCHDG